MTSRRNFLTLVGAGAAVTLLGCDTTSGAPVTAAARAELPDVLLVDTANGLGVVRGGSVTALGPAVVTADGRTIFAARGIGPDTEVLTIETDSGQVTRSVRLPGAWVPAVASPLAAALIAPTHDSGAAPVAYAPAGRASTSVMIIAFSGTTRRLDLAGNYVPDAFSNDGTGLFVLDWLPSGAPEHYRVREVNVDNGRPSPLLTRDKQPVPPEAEEQMRGFRRNAVFGPRWDVLYTLYTHQPGTVPSERGWPGADNAFVHTLQLDQHWAYCVDLPAPFGLDPNASHALAADGSRLFVVDAAAGKLAVVDTESLAVSDVATLPAAAGSAYAVAASDAVHIAVGARLTAIDKNTLAPRQARTMTANVLGLVASADGSRIYVGTAGAVDCYDAATWQQLGRVSVAGLTGLRQAV